MLQPWEDPSKEVLAVSKYFQHQTSLLESSAIPQVLHLQTELGSKAQTKLEMMLDKMEPMKFHEIMHFENLLMLYGHLESQYDISQADGYTCRRRDSCFKSSLQLFIQLFDSETHQLPYTKIHTVVLDPCDAIAAAKGLEMRKTIS